MDEALTPVDVGPRCFPHRRSIELAPLTHIACSILLYILSVLTTVILLFVSPQSFLSTNAELLSTSSSPFRHSHFEISDLRPVNHFLVCDFIAKWNLPLDPIPFNISIQTNLTMISSDTILNLSTTTTDLTVWDSSESLPIRVFHQKPINFTTFEANLTVLFPSNVTFPGTFVWSIGQPGQAIVDNFLRYAFFLAGVILLWLLIRTGDAFSDSLTQQLTFLLCGTIIASDPFYILIFYTSGSAFRVVDSLLHLFFITIGMLFLPFLVLRQPKSEEREKFCRHIALNVFPFVLAFCVTGMLTVRAVLDLDDDPATGSNPALHIARTIVVGLDLVVITPLAYLYRSDLVNEKLFVVTLAVVFPIAELISEIGQFFNPLLIGNVQIFELIVAVEHVAFFATHTWPGKSGINIREEDTGSDTSKTIGEKEAMLYGPDVKY
jgi:hypothetical protein